MPQYLHGHHDSVLRSHRWRTAENSAGYLLEIIREGWRLLDVGCGPGTITVDLAARVRPGPVVGLEVSSTVLLEARARAEEGRVSNVSFVSGDIYRAPFCDATFDLVHAHQVLQHLTDPVVALVAMARTCRAGGWVAARDCDYGRMSWKPSDPLLERWLELYESCARADGAEPDAGRWLTRWARGAGFEDVVESNSTWTFSTPEDRSWWGALWAERVTSSRLAERAVALGLSDMEELEAVASAWRRWADCDRAEFTVPHGEILCKVR